MMRYNSFLVSYQQQKFIYLLIQRKIVNVYLAGTLCYHGNDPYDIALVRYSRSEGRCVRRIGVSTERGKSNLRRISRNRS